MPLTTPLLVSDKPTFRLVRQPGPSKAGRSIASPQTAVQSAFTAPSNLSLQKQVGWDPRGFAAPGITINFRCAMMVDGVRIELVPAFCVFRKSRESSSQTAHVTFPSGFDEVRCCRFHRQSNEDAKSHIVQPGISKMPGCCFGEGSSGVSMRYLKLAGRLSDCQMISVGIGDQNQ